MKFFPFLRKYLLLVVFVPFFASAQDTTVVYNTTDFYPYCEVGYDSQYNMFTDLSINESFFDDFGPVGSWINTTPHRYFNTHEFESLQAGDSFDLSITFPSVNDIEPSYFAVWIDFNGDEEFTGDEMVMHSANTINAKLPSFGDSSITVSQTINIPLDAVDGNTRMRIMRGQNDDNPYGDFDPQYRLDSCGGFLEPNFPAFGYNCTVDFNLNINNNLSSNVFFNKNFKIFPNPAHDVLYIDSGTENVKIHIYNSLGKLIKSYQKINQINLSEYKSGIYFVGFYSIVSNKNIKVSKLIIN